MAAVALQSTAPQTFQPSNLAASSTHAVTVDAGSDRCMIVCVQGEGTAGGGISVTSVTYNAVALTRLVDASNASWSWTEIWYLAAPATGSNNLVVTLDAADDRVIGVLVAQGVDQTSPMRTGVSATGTATSASVTVASVAADDLVFDSLSLDSTGHNPVPGADQTERWEVDAPGAGNEGATDTQPGTAGGVMSQSWTTSCLYSYAAGAFVAVSGGGGSPAAKKLASQGVG